MLIRYKNAIFGTCNTAPCLAEKPTWQQCPRVFSQFGFLSAALRLDQTKRNEILRFKSICGLFTGVVRRNSIYNNEYNQEILRVGMYKLNY